MQFNTAVTAILQDMSQCGLRHAAHQWQEGRRIGRSLQHNPLLAWQGEPGTCVAMQASFGSLPRQANHLL